MKLLFQGKGNAPVMIDWQKRIFRFEGEYFNMEGTPVEYTEKPQNFDDNYDFYTGDSGLEVPLFPESTVEIEWEIDDGFGCFGYKNEAGEFVIEPQYAYASSFTNGLACVNLNRTWFRTENGERYYENHYGYIDSRGKTVIEFQYDEAYPFNKYGVAVVYHNRIGWHLIDQNGDIIPGSAFSEICPYYNYENRFISFHSCDSEKEDFDGVYDTKERKILLEPIFSDFLELDEDCIKIYEHPLGIRISDFGCHYRDSEGNVLYPWLYGNGFVKAERPDENGVAAVAIAYPSDLIVDIDSGQSRKWKDLYGLFSSKRKFLLMPEYDQIQYWEDNVWCCCKGASVMIVKTETED